MNYAAFRGLSENVVYDLEAGETACCYYCIEQGCYDEYARGKAFLAGPRHSPCDGNANFICWAHLDADAALPDTYPADFIAVAQGSAS